MNLLLSSCLHWPLLNRPKIIILHQYNMPYIYVISFTNPSGTYSYRAFSSTDPTRANSKLYLDICWEIGFQPTYPVCKQTLYGLIHDYNSINWSVDIHDRGSTITCVINNNHMLNTAYPIKAQGQAYNTNVPVTEGIITQIEHSCIDPNPYYPESDSDSDSE